MAAALDGQENDPDPNSLIQSDANLDMKQLLLAMRPGDDRSPPRASCPSWLDLYPFTQEGLEAMNAAIV